MFDDLLIHTVEVYARSGRKDRFGQPVDVNPRQHTAGEEIVHTYPCRVYQKEGALQMMERSIDTFEKVYTLFAQPDADINEDDAVRITEGSRVLVPLAKLKDLQRVYAGGSLHHLEIGVWVQSGPNPSRGA